MPLAVVTDSTASLPGDVVAARGIEVVPLQVVVGDEAYDEGRPEVSPDRIAAALRKHRPVSTSRPGPQVLLEAYRRAAEAGATEIVSVHLSGEISGTVESALVAARQAPVPVRCVDTRQVGVATGYAALDAAGVRDAGGTRDDAARAAEQRAARCSSLFYVDTLEHLRRGGRIGAASALVGGALAVKPLLRIEDGRVGTLERVRTASRALARLQDLAVEAAGSEEVDVCVAHLDAADRAAELCASLGERLAGGLEEREVYCTQLGAVLGAHVGPGMLAVCVAPRTEHS